MTLIDAGLIAGLLSFQAQALSAWTSQFVHTPIEITAAIRVDGGAELSSVIDAALGVDGRLCLADYRAAQVVCVNAAGKLIHRVGREGRGPGEFTGLYRVAMSSDGNLLAYDRRRNTVTTFDTAGRFLRERRLPFRFAQVDAIVAARGQLFVSGVAAPLTGDASDAIHRFSLGDSVQYEGHFGPLPEARSVDYLRLWGAGSLRGVEGDRLVFTRKGPYELYVYTAAGTLVDRVVPNVPAGLGADDAFEQTANGQLGLSKKVVTIPAAGTQLDTTLLLATRVIRGGQRVQWDFIEGVTGRTVTADLGRTGLLSLDTVRGALWVIQDDPDGLPIVTRLTFRRRIAVR